MEGARIHYTFSDNEWAYVRATPENIVRSVVGSFEDSVRSVKEGLTGVVRAVRLTGRDDERVCWLITQLESCERHPQS